MISCDLFLHPINAGRDDVTWAPETLKKLKKKCWEQGKGLHLTEQFPNVFCDLVEAFANVLGAQVSWKQAESTGYAFSSAFLNIMKMGASASDFLF